MFPAERLDHIGRGVQRMNLISETQLGESNQLDGKEQFLVTGPRLHLELRVKVLSPVFWHGCSPIPDSGRAPPMPM